MTIWRPRLDGLKGPQYIKIADAIEKGVGGGELGVGARLPTHRELANHLGVTVGTVTRGYSEAERRGLIVGEVGRGTFVRSGGDPSSFGWREIDRSADTGLIDMSLACPWIAPDGADGREMGRTLREIANEENLNYLLAYDPTTACERHRAVAANWIGKLGLEVSPDHVVVTSGAQHAMTVILSSLLGTGDTIATAELTYPGFRAVARMFGVSIQGIEMDGEGIIPKALDAACLNRKIRALYCVPTIQNPTGVTMSLGRRRAIADVARRRDLIVIEDEIHMSFPDQKIPPIASFAPERALLIATLSKWVAFGLRVAFVAAPQRAAERLRNGVRTSQWQTAPLMAEVATRWLVDGTAERMAQRKLTELRARHSLVREILGDRLVIQTHPHALHLWVQLPEPLRSDECVAQARQRGVLIAGAEAFAVGRSVPHAVRMSIAQVPHRADLRRGLEVLRAVFDGCSDPYVQIL